MKQPFSYQQSSHSCWITSVHNALIYFLEDKNKLPHNISRTIYMNSTETGVSDKEVILVLNTIRELTGISYKIFRSCSITPKLLTKYLSCENTVMISDTQSGRHSVLVTDMHDQQMIAFDPSWNNVKDSISSPEGFTCTPYGNPEMTLLNSHKNVAINTDYFLDRKKGPGDLFAMGEMPHRFAVFMEKPQ